MKDTTVSKNDIGTARNQMSAAYRAELDKMSRANRGRIGFTKRQIDDMVAGFEDGTRNMLAHLVKTGAVILSEP